MYIYIYQIRKEKKSWIVSFRENERKEPLNFIWAERGPDAEPLYRMGAIASSSVRTNPVCIRQTLPGLVSAETGIGQWMTEDQSCVHQTDPSRSGKCRDRHRPMDDRGPILCASDRPFQVW